MLNGLCVCVIGFSQDHQMSLVEIKKSTEVYNFERIMAERWHS